MYITIDDDDDDDDDNDDDHDNDDDGDDDNDDYIHDDDASMYASTFIRPDRLPVSISTPSYASPSSLLCYLVDTKSE